MSLTLIFWIVGLVVGGLMYLQAYAWNWKGWQCLAFAAAMMLATVLVLSGCRSTGTKLLDKLAGVLGAVKDKLG